ncbi:MAG TPA: hypothetical protein VKR31_16390 [Rhizomicrobium sp.]|nr:hypothetical protein [Rhizomicrobium sp.]
MLALKLRAPEPEPNEIVACDAYWVCDVEPCGAEWMFSVIGPDEAIETFVYDSQPLAECARARMLRTLCPAVAIAA